MQIDFAKCSFGKEERTAVNRVLQGNWLASGPEGEAFEKEFAEYVGTKYAICVNSGSSANLLALSSLNLRKGSKVLTSACGFPATLSPILHLGLTPVLVDYDIATHNIDIDQVLNKICNINHDIKAIIFAHTLGNPVDMKELIVNCDLYDVPIIEDCCESIGTKVNGKSVGSFGTCGTFSFYPSHQMTALGGGGMITTNDEGLMKEMKSMRDWGKMWDWNSDKGNVTTSYTTKVDGMDYFPGYAYQTIGYNFKLPEANCAFGREQLKRLDGFRKQREENFIYLYKNLAGLDAFLDIEVDWKNTEISWFGFPMTLKDSFGSRNAFGDFLESCGIRHRPFFAGNILRHKPFSGISSAYAGNFPVADKLMRDSLFVGCWPGMTKEMLDYIIEKVKTYVDSVHIKL